jgi:hypothetical protein
VSVHPAFEKLFRFIPSLERAPKNYQTYADDLLAKGFPEVSRHIANEAVNGRLRDAVPYYCVHGFSQWAKRWFVETVEVQLRFSRSYWIDRELNGFESQPNPDEQAEVLNHRNSGSP